MKKVIKGGDSGKKIRQGPVFTECLLCTSTGLVFHITTSFDLYKSSVRDENESLFPSFCR